MMRVGQIPKCGCGKTKHPPGYCDGSHSQVTEADVRDYFKKQAKAVGWLARKVSWEGVNNAPDWVLMKKPDLTVWVELKRPGKAPTASQRIEHEVMRHNGQIVVVICSYADVNDLFETLCKKKS